MINKLQPKKEFARHVLTLMTGGIIAQIIPIAISPILTRLYSPEHFGIFALYMSISSLLATIATGRYEFAIVLPKKESDANQLLILSILISILVGFIVFLTVLVFYQELLSLFHSKEMTSWLYFIPITVVVTGIYQSLGYWHNRKKNYRKLSISKINGSVLGASINLICAYLGAGSLGLISASLGGRLIEIITLLKRTKLNLTLNLERLIFLSKKYKKFPLSNSPHAFINVLKDIVVSIFISINYSTMLLGYYYFVLRILQTPSSLIASSLFQVFYRKASLVYTEKKDIQKLVRKLILTLSLLALLPALFIFMYSEDLFVIIFGEDWKEAGRLAKAMVLYIYFHFIISPLGVIPLITNKQDVALYWGVFESALYILIFLLGYIIFNDLFYTLLLLSAVFSIFFPVYFIWLYNISKVTK